VRLSRSSRRSGSVRWRPLTFCSRAGRRAVVAMGRRIERLDDGVRRFNRVEMSSLVVFSFGDRRRSCV